MKKAFVIFFLSVYMFSTTELSQLLKMPVLISHFIEHKDQDKNMTFLDYIIHHYGGHEMDADWETDMKLPFMQHADVLSVIVIPGNHYLNILPKTAPFSDSRQFIFYNDNDIPSSCLSSIWQPPKFC